MVDHENKVIEFRPSDEDGMGKMLVSVIGDRLEFCNTVERHEVGKFIHGNEAGSVAYEGEKVTFIFDCYADCYDFMDGLGQIELCNTNQFVFKGCTVKFLPGTFESLLGIRRLTRRIIGTVLQKEFVEVLDF